MYQGTLESTLSNICLLFFSKDVLLVNCTFKLYIHCIYLYIYYIKLIVFIFSDFILKHVSFINTILNTHLVDLYTTCRKQRTLAGIY